MNILFLSGLFPDCYKDEIEKKSIGVIQYAADALQWSIVRGWDLYFRDVFSTGYSCCFSDYFIEYKESGFQKFNFSFAHIYDSIFILWIFSV